jgi:uncharacterized protein YbjT (DUF2867 family)
MILITGSTALTGSAVVREFVRRGRAARALVRDPRRARSWDSGAGIRAVAGDLLRPRTLPAVLEGVGTVVMISGADRRMVEAQGNLVDAAAEAGVRHVVKVSGLYPALDSPFRYGRYHGQIEGHLAASGMAWTMLRPSQFMQVYYREVPSMLAEGEIAMPLGAARLAPVDVEDVAEAAYVAATTPGHESAVYELTGPEALSMTEVCDILGEVVGRPIRYADVAPEEKRRRTVAAGIPEPFADDMADLFRLRREIAPESRVSVEAFERLGIRPATFAEFARRSAAVFRGVATPERLWAAGWLEAAA